MENRSITVAGTNDITALVALVNSAYRGDKAREGWTHEADLLNGQRIDAEGMAALLANGDTTILKYTDNSRIVGCVCLEKKDSHLYLGMLTTAPEFQGKGIGKVMLREAERHAVRLGCKLVEMTVITDRKELMAWYERHGYKNTGVLKPFPSHDPRAGVPLKPLQFVVMEKML